MLRKQACLLTTFPGLRLGIPIRLRHFIVSESGTQCHNMSLFIDN